MILHLRISKPLLNLMCIIYILGKTVGPQYDGKTSRNRVSDVAELKDDIVTTVLVEFR